MSKCKLQLGLDTSNIDWLLIPIKLAQLVGSKWFFFFQIKTHTLGRDFNFKVTFLGDLYNRMLLGFLFIVLLDLTNQTCYQTELKEERYSI